MRLVVSIWNLTGQSCCLNLHSNGIMSSTGQYFFALTKVNLPSHCTPTLQLLSNCFYNVFSYSLKWLPTHEEGFYTQYHWLPISVAICFSNKKAYKYCLWSNWTWHDKFTWLCYQLQYNVAHMETAHYLAAIFFHVRPVATVDIPQ